MRQQVPVTSGAVRCHRPHGCCTTVAPDRYRWVG